MDDRTREKIYAGVSSALITIGAGLVIVATYLTITRVTIPMIVNAYLGAYFRD